MMLRNELFATALAIGLSAVTLAPSTGCTAGDKDRVKGEVDQSLPPGTPGPTGTGKADSATDMVALSAESPHPYTNNLSLDVPIALQGVVPSCATRARLHFSVLRVENGYDYVTITSTGDAHSQRLTGQNDDSFSDWFDLGAGQAMNVNLASDYSITDHGFEIDSVQYEANPICPTIAWPPCAAGEIDITPPTGVCGCPRQPVCVSVDDVEIQHQLFRGFNNHGEVVSGTDAFTTAPGPGDGIVRTQVGTVDRDAVRSFVQSAASAGLLASPGYDSTGPDWNDYFRVRAGATEVVFRAPQGQHTVEVARAVDDFQALFACDTGATTCDSGYTCTDGACVEDAGCICTEQYEPVCGVDNHTYGNACKAGCAGMDVRHLGECGTDGDMCGGFGGFLCADGFKCQYPGGGNAPYPDAAGTCKAEDYCDIPADCANLTHPAQAGQWECNANTCEWAAGSAWVAVAGWSFATTHPYTNDASAWKQLYLPEGATQMRLVTGAFELEDGYDFLEVWTWDGGWKRIDRFTGTTGPGDDDVYAGRYFYLHFVSDYSVTKRGFDVTAEYQ